MKVLVGIDIGGTKTAVIIGEARGTSTEPSILGRLSFPTDTERPWRRTLSRAIEACRELAGKAGAGGIEGIGVSCGGHLDSRAGRILSPPNLPGWDRVPVTEVLSEALPGITAQAVGEAAEKGDALAREILAESGRRLGQGLAILIDVLNPERIVIGSIYARCRAFLEPSMRESIRAEVRAGGNG